ncbi:MAG: arginine repressor [Planctomycetes bacterium]|nr:arginine repressor [Planctomycetota bacterium]
MILKIIDEKAVSTLGQLGKELRSKGVSVDTATLSRDARELGIIRSVDEGGTLRYVASNIVPQSTALPSKSLLSKFIRGLDWSGNTIVIKTLTGTAPTVGEFIDKLKWKEICGTVAGDNTLMVVVARGFKAAAVMKRLEKWLI